MIKVYARLPLLALTAGLLMTGAALSQESKKPTELQGQLSPATAPSNTPDVKGNTANKKAEKKQASSNTTTVDRLPAMPDDFPTYNVAGGDENDFFVYIKQKTTWFEAHPEYLEQKRGLTRISAGYYNSLSAEVRNYIDSHAAEFNILGSK